MKKIVFLFVLALLVQSSFAQQYDLPVKPSEAVAEAARLRLPFQNVSALFQKKAYPADKHSPVRKAVREGVLLDFNSGKANWLLNQQADAIRLSLPAPSGRLIELELVKVNLFSPAFSVTTPDSSRPVSYNPGLHYQGIVKGVPNSIAAISVFDNEVMGMFSTPEDGNFVLGPLDAPAGTQKQKTHILYQEKDLIPKYDFKCGAEDYPESDHEPDSGHEHSSDKVQSTKCISVYFDVEHDIYTWCNSDAVATANYIAGMFNQSAVLFANESLTFQLYQIHVWTSYSPLGHMTSDNDNRSWGIAYKHMLDSLHADFGHFVSFKIPGGWAGSLNGLCSPNMDNGLCVSGISTSYSTVPTYSWSVFVLTHEMGHLCGSPHTHHCSWNGNSTAIDGCHETEGSCVLPAIPSGGGTIMSYCYTKSTGVNFSKGFGSQPGNLIRARVNNASCLSCSLIGKKIALAAANGQYVCADNSGNSDLIANRNSIGEWEQFDVVDAGNGYIALRARINNKYVCADGGGALNLIANRTAIGDWERFNWIGNSSGVISLKAKANSKFVGARSGGGSTLFACCTTIDGWERFNITVLGDSKQATQPAPAVKGLQAFKVYPNPADEVLNLQGVEPGLDVEIFNLQGKRLIDTQTAEWMDISTLSPGIYLIRINGYQTLKFTKL